MRQLVWSLVLVGGLAQGVMAQVGSGKAGGMHHAVGTFEVKMKPEPLSDVAGKSAIMRMSIDKVLHGQLEATSQGEFLAVGSPDGSGGYVAMERVTGTLDGRQGSFALMHSSTMIDKVPQMTITVVPGSGTGALAGISGTFKVIIEGGKHSYDFEYTL